MCGALEWLTEERRMTVGEVIALLCEYCSDEDYLLMCKSTYLIEVYDDYILVCTSDSNTSNIRIERKE